MLSFLQKNWFRVGLLLIAAFVAWAIYSALIIQPAEKAREAVRDKEEEKSTEAAILGCLTDAYKSYSIHKNNIDTLYLSSCADDMYSAGCDSEFIEELKDSAKRDYEEEWVPQCKLGNRVFIMHEPWQPQ